VINLFDSLYVPGTLRNMTIYLHYNASNATYLDIGEKRVWEDVPNGSMRTVTLGDSYLRNFTQGNLDYTFLSNKTVPLRMAAFSHNYTIVTSGDADIVLITDFSGSMKKAVGTWDQGNLGGNCAVAFGDPTYRRTLLAQCVDNEFVTSILNYSGNRIWPVMLYDDAVQWYNNPTDGAAINGYINSFANGRGKTCYACAFNLAHDILANYSNSSRKKFIVFMTDGTPTHCASGSCTSNSVSFGTLQCQGMCDTSGSCGQSDIAGLCTECINNPGGRTNALYSANRSVLEMNTTIYTVGFGPVDACSLGTQTLLELAALGNGTYQQSNDSTRLRWIYTNITQEILTRTNLVAQVAATIGPQSSSQLFPDSHINITYELASQYLPEQNEITITLQSPQACDPIVPVYAEQQLVEVKAISYSGVHWSDYLGVNGVEVYNLSAFLLPYDRLGDPTVIHAPITSFATGINTMHIENGDSVSNKSTCAANNSAIYTVAVNLSTERSTVVPKSEGCKWTVQFEDDTYQNITIPAGYGGSNLCSYAAGNIAYDSEDAYQLGAYTLFQRLDFRKNGKLYVNLRDEDLEIIVTTISKVPYMWGPSIMRLEVTR
jgi:hypothetical protein